MTRDFFNFIPAL